MDEKQLTVERVHKASTMSPKGWKKPQLSLFTCLVLALVILLICLVYSFTVGAAEIPLSKILASFLAFDGSYEHLVIQTVRLPRSLVAILVGSALAVSGALMQGLTRNPLADPAILGIESGAALAVVATIFIFGSSSLSVLTIVAFLGAGATAMLVYFLGSLGRGGATPLNLTVAGAALTALISSFTTAILIVSQRTLEEIRFWLAGSLAGRDVNILLQALPFVLIGLIVAFALGRQITTMSLGEDVAKGLGQQTTPIYTLPLSAFAGALLMAVLIYVLAWNNGSSPILLILMGIGLSAIASAFSSLIITFGEIYDVSNALVWLAGSVYGRALGSKSFPCSPG